ncbi:DUF4097 family beta strand repeat-containing protein [Streptomyces sp. NPDC047315]|uniref:DUF4097 family beta strand repeat-containing protein n=1 Tax=Streptomyces sp. NPDC047315 TaxID=3155142 RepID=UPI0033FDDBD4
MPQFATPEPVTATVNLVAGSARIVASDRTDTVVEVLPAFTGKEGDADVAKETTVSFAGGRLLVQAPKGKVSRRESGAVRVLVELPRGSVVEGTIAMGGFTVEGELERCRLTATEGDLSVDRAEAVQLSTRHGDVAVGAVTASARITTGTGQVRIGRVAGRCEIDNSNGATRVDEARGTLRVKATRGDVSIGRSLATVNATTALGIVSVNEVAAGRVEVRVRQGSADIGLLDGVPAQLDVKATFGTVYGSLGAVEDPGDAEDVVVVHARVDNGDIHVRRAHSTERQPAELAGARD